MYLPLWVWCYVDSIGFICYLASTQLSLIVVALTTQTIIPSWTVFSVTHRSSWMIMLPLSAFLSQVMAFIDCWLSQNRRRSTGESALSHEHNYLPIRRVNRYKSRGNRQSSLHFYNVRVISPSRLKTCKPNPFRCLMFSTNHQLASRTKSAYWGTSVDHAEK